MSLNRGTGFIEACYRFLEPDRVWASELVSAFRSLFRNPEHVVCHDSVISKEHRLETLWYSGDEPLQYRLSHEGAPRSFIDRLNAFGPNSVRAAYAHDAPTVRVASQQSAAIRDALQSCLPRPQNDCLALLGSVSGREESFIVLGMLHRDQLDEGPRAKERLLGLCRHLSVADELRRMQRDAQLEAKIAARIVPGTAKIEADEDVPVSTQALLVTAARRMDRARCRRFKHSDEETLRRWEALVAGEYALIETVEKGGKRTLVAVRTSSNASLTARERQVCGYAAQGASNKLIAAELGVSVSTVGVHLGSAMRKLSCRNRVELVRWYTQARRTST